MKICNFSSSFLSLFLFSELRQESKILAIATCPHTCKVLTCLYKNKKPEKHCVKFCFHWSTYIFGDDLYFTIPHILWISVFHILFLQLLWSLLLNHISHWWMSTFSALLMPAAFFLVFFSLKDFIYAHLWLLMHCLICCCHLILWIIPFSLCWSRR